MTAKPKKIKRIYVIYWVLLAYIIAALVWWFIALMQQNQIMVNIRKAELIKSDYNYDLKFKAIEEDRKRKIAQYVGEGSIFFTDNCRRRICIQGNQEATETFATAAKFYDGHYT